MPRIPRFRPEQLDEPARATFDAIAGGERARGVQHFPLTGDDGALNGPFNAFLLSPSVGTALQELGSAIRYRTSLTPRQRELAILLVAAHEDSAFEWESHEAVGRAAGLTEHELAALRLSDPAVFAADERVCAQTVLALLAGDVDDEQWRAATEALGIPAVFELSTLVGYYRTLALQLRVFRVE